jgi:hypothetical protein
MNKLKSTWEHAGWEVYAHRYESDTQDQELVRVPGSIPAVYIFNWSEDPAPLSIASRVGDIARQVWYTVQLLIGDFIDSAICHFRGHDLVDDSHATPDHGYAGETCQQCGAHNGRTLY